MIRLEQIRRFGVRLDQNSVRGPVRGHDTRPEICLVRAVWQPKPDVEPFQLNLSEYFAEVWGEANA